MGIMNVKVLVGGCLYLGRFLEPAKNSSETWGQIVCGIPFHQKPTSLLFDYKVKKQNGTVMIFDIVRKKYVVLTPEEWVRQHVVHYLVEKKGYAISRVAVEREIELYGLKRRFDIVVFDRSGNPWLLVECKAPAVALTQKVFDQVFRYNLTLAAPYVAITNGVRHFCGYMNQENDFCFLDDFPEFSQERELLA